MSRGLVVAAIMKVGVAMWLDSEDRQLEVLGFAQRFEGDVGWDGDGQLDAGRGCRVASGTLGTTSWCAWIDLLCCPVVMV